MYPHITSEHAADNDSVVTMELQAAGIDPTKSAVYFYSRAGVATEVRGTLHNWFFERHESFWECRGPGIPLQYAERLYRQHPQTVCADGDASGPDPRARFKGLACGLYHVYDSAGLSALVDILNLIVESAVNEVPSSLIFTAPNSIN